MKKVLKKLGIAIILLGLVLIMNSSLMSITGNVVNENIRVGGSILGIIFIIGGIALFLAEKGLELKVYDVSKGKKPSEKGRFYEMTDPETYFREVGYVNLSEFKKGIKEIEDDPELIHLIKKEYGLQLLDIEKTGSTLEKNVAEEFLKILYHGKIPREEKELITKEEKTEIRNVFDPGWTGSPDTRQSRVLKKYGFLYGAGKGHGEIYFAENPNIKTYPSASPSDIDAGKNLARRIIHLIREYRKSA